MLPFRSMLDVGRVSDLDPRIRFIFRNMSQIRDPAMLARFCALLALPERVQLPPE